MIKAFFGLIFMPLIAVVFIKGIYLYAGFLKLSILPYLYSEQLGLAQALTYVVLCMPLIMVAIMILGALGACFFEGFSKDGKSPEENGKN